MKPITYSNALIIPAPTGSRGRGVLPVAVFDSDGNRVADGDCAANALSSGRFVPTEDDHRAQRRLPGRWLYGGIASRHFGHQITRMLGRLPHADHMPALDGIVFAAFNRSSGALPERKTRERLFRFLGQKLPVHVAFEPTRVDELAVGPDLFSEGTQGTAHPDFVAWTQARLRLSEIPIEEGNKVYVTRDRLSGTVGRILCEDLLEQNLRAAGFTIFAPEQHDLKTQFETYARAETIVMSDGSPGHVTAFAMRPGQTQVVIARRAERPLFLLNHLESFAKTGATFTYLSALDEQWWPEHRASHISMGQLDFEAVRSRMIDLNVVPEDSEWQSPSPADLENSKRRGLPTHAIVMPDKDRARYTTNLKRAKQHVLRLKELDDQKLELPPIEGMRYIRALRRIHEILRPEWYLEVGTFRGRSLEVSRGNYVAVDPTFRIDKPVVTEGAEQMFLFQKTSDDFFATDFLSKNGIRPNLMFLDGLHYYEALLKDFINAERNAEPESVIILHDCCPTSHSMTSRLQTQDAWTGDVWKTFLILKRYRPDLQFTVLDAAPTGLVVVQNLSPESTVLSDAYDDILAEYDPLSLDQFPKGLLGYYDQFEITPVAEGLKTLRIGENATL